MTMTIEAPPGDIDRPSENDDLRQRIDAAKAGAVRIHEARLTAVLLAAHLARLARAYRRDRDRLWLANLGLQADLDRAGVREAFTAAQIDGLAAHIVDLQAERRALAARVEALESENSRLRASNAADQAETAARPARGRWRR